MLKTLKGNDTIRSVKVRGIIIFVSFIHCNMPADPMCVSKLYSNTIPHYSSLQILFRNIKRQRKLAISSMAEIYTKLLKILPLNSRQMGSIHE